MIELSPEHYDGFLGKCDVSSLEYSTLKNGVVSHNQINGHDQRMIKILCEEEKAAMFFDSATRVYPEAVAAIAPESITRASCRAVPLLFFFLHVRPAALQQQRIASLWSVVEDRGAK